MGKYIEIYDVFAREVLDSRGNPTVEVEVHTKKSVGRATVPSGASTGEHEAVELRDNDKNRYRGMGVKKAVDNVNNIIADSLIGMNVLDQRRIDIGMISLDGTLNKSRLGANAILGVSIACARAAANALDMPLYRYIGGTNAYTIPVPMMNILNGGAHAGNNVDIQEFMIMPVGAPDFHEGLRWCCEVYYKLKEIVNAEGGITAVGDEGGFAPDLETDEKALELIVNAIGKAGFVSGRDFKIAVDAAASGWMTDDGYVLPKSGVRKTTDELIDYFDELTDKYPIFSIEDALGENDWDGWERLTKRLGDKIQLVGDDLFVTDTQRLNKGIYTGAANAILIKVNQIGTLTQALDAAELAHKSGYRAIVSHRSGETEDTTISDIAVAINSGQIKTGAPARTDRVAKYNRLLRIEEELGNCAVYGEAAAD